jgi:HAD superfamily hydrolase (TIGR01549 family)
MILLFPYCTRLPSLMNIRNSFAGKVMKDGDDLIKEIAQKIAGKSLNSSTDSVINWINSRFYPAFEKIMPFLRGSRPDLNDTLQAVKKKHYKLAVLSDFAWIKERLRGLNINDTLFDTLLSAETEGALKPSPLSFNNIADKWSIIPSEILVIGDKKDTDGKGAYNAGMQFMQITDKMVTPKVYNWKSIKKFLEGLPSVE